MASVYGVFELSLNDTGPGTTWEAEVLPFLGLFALIFLLMTCTESVYLTPVLVSPVMEEKRRVWVKGPLWTG